MVKSSLPSSFPVVYGPHIYLCKSAAAREAFMADVVPLATQRPAQPPALHRIVVIGAPKSGKTSLAAWLARELGVKHIDACSAVEELVQGISHLAIRVKSLLRSGQVCGWVCGCVCVCAAYVALRTGAGSVGGRRVCVCRSDAVPGLGPRWLPYHARASRAAGKQEPRHHTRLCPPGQGREFQGQVSHTHTH
jgi:hypothetical protein